MTMPEPVAGQVIRYAYLWHAEAATGTEEAVKDRPCAIVVATRREDDGILVVVAPITHSGGDDPSAEVEIPPAVRRRLGLDSERQWVRVDEVNTFIWPGYDLRPIPGRAREYVYGMLPARLFADIKRRLLDLRNGRRLKATSRVSSRQE